ncbi:MAG: mandelate racemase [Burkholderiaceae bacterium]|nr:mandelate racemase [Burkholderiaceae bacterium]
MTAPRFVVEAIDLFERDVALRMPFRFGVVTLTAAPQAFVRARVRLADGRAAEGMAAELLAPKWFDKNPALTNEDNFDQLRAALGIARGLYLDGASDTAFGHFARHYAEQLERGAGRGLVPLVANYGPALIDRALLDALCRALQLPFHEVIRANGAGIAPGELCPDLAGFDWPAFLGTLRPATRIEARHTVGLVDPITRTDQTERVGDGLPETLEEVVATYGHRWFKLKVAGDVDADLQRLARIAAVLDRIGGGYRASLDGNEQYDDVDGIAELWRRMNAEPALARLCASVVFIEQPIKRQAALARNVRALSSLKAVIIDESDDSLHAFVRARELGYQGVSSKTCKGLYKSLINNARCAQWNAAAGEPRWFMSAEDLTIQAGLALQQDLALVSLMGIEHVERNGHHYVNGMAALGAGEQQAFLEAHPDLYERSHGAVRVRIRDGALSIGSLGCTGFASGAAPDWSSMRPMATGRTP